MAIMGFNYIQLKCLKSVEVFCRIIRPFGQLPLTNRNTNLAHLFLPKIH